MSVENISPELKEALKRYSELKRITQEKITAVDKLRNDLSSARAHSKDAYEELKRYSESIKIIFNFDPDKKH
jgi:hypothetical protein